MSLMFLGRMVTFCALEKQGREFKSSYFRRQMESIIRHLATLDNVRISRSEIRSSCAFSLCASGRGKVKVGLFKMLGSRHQKNDDKSRYASTSVRKEMFRVPTWSRLVITGAFPLDIAWMLRPCRRGYVSVVMEGYKAP